MTTSQQSAIDQQPMPAPVVQPVVQSAANVTQQNGVVRKLKPKPKLTQSVITRDDSIKLNLIPLFPAESDPFLHNVLTQHLHPLPQGDSVFVEPSDTLIHIANPDTIKTATIVEQPNRIMQEKKLLPSGFNVDLVWLLPALVVIVAITGWIRLASGKFFRELFQAVFYHTSSDNLYKITHFRKSAWSVGLNFLFLINLGLFVYEMMTHFGIRPAGIDGLALWGIATGVLMTVSFLKTGIYRFLGWVFNTREATRRFLFEVTLLNKAFGIILVPFIVVIPYVHPQYEFLLLVSGLVMFAVMYLIQLLKGVKIILHEPLSVFYMILYLCALEILPIVTIYKIVVLQSAR
jgi:hypothetical protein